MSERILRLHKDSHHGNFPRQNTIVHFSHPHEASKFFCTLFSSIYIKKKQFLACHLYMNLCHHVRTLLFVWKLIEDEGGSVVSIMDCYSHPVQYWRNAPGDPARSNQFSHCRRRFQWTWKLRILEWVILSMVWQGMTSALQVDTNYYDLCLYNRLCWVSILYMVYTIYTQPVNFLALIFYYTFCGGSVIRHILQYLYFT